MITSKELVLIVKIIWFLVIHMSLYFLFLYLDQSQVIRNSVAHVYRKTREKEKLRYERETRIRYEDGNQDKINFLYRLDLLLLQSNLKKVFPFLNSEIYLIFMLCASAFGFVVTDVISSSYILGTVSSLLITLICYVILYFLSGLNYKKTENEILSFVNLLENYSKTNDDIISIFGKLYHYLEEPLKTAVEECYLEGRNTGDLSFALYNLSNRIEHPKFKEIIRNIEICTRHEANYAEIVKDNRELLREYIAMQKERKAIINNGRIEIGIILTCCMIMVSMLDSFMEQGIWNILLHSSIGNGILLYCILVTFVSMFDMIAFDKK